MNYLNDPRYADFEVLINPDWDLGAPQDQYDGHGPVRVERRAYKRPTKAPGEVLIYSESGVYVFYDLQGATQKARKEGWGLTDADRKELERGLAYKAARDHLNAVTPGKLCFNISEAAIAEHHRPASKAEITAEAVRKDMERLRGWYAGDWHWASITVSAPCPITGEMIDESLFGVESDNEEHIKMVVLDLAQELAQRLAIRKQSMPPALARTPQEVTDELGALEGSQRLYAMGAIDALRWVLDASVDSPSGYTL